MAAKEDSKAPLQYITPVKSANDQRSYRWLKLSNHLEVLLVSDPTSEKAGGALQVAVGQFSDPDHALGLAHFLEHMLFLGTKKYPEENSYSSFIKSNGGFDNAYTEFEVRSIPHVDVDVEC